VIYAREGLPHKVKLEDVLKYEQGLLRDLRAKGDLLAAIRTDKAISQKPKEVKAHPKITAKTSPLK